MSTERENGGGDLIDRDLLHRYRKASAELDERPSASTRASILAAAAREVQAKPMAAGAAHRRRPSWPLAAAAVVMLSTLAVTLAIRTQEEMPQFSRPEPIGSAAEVAASPPAAAPAPDASRGTEEGARAKQSAPAPQSAPAQELARVAENQPSATRDAALNSQKRRESDQAAAAPRERKQEPAPTPNTAPANVAPAAPPPAAPSVPKTQSADAAPPAAEAPVAAGSALRKAQGEVNAGLGASARDQAASAAADARADAPKRTVPAPAVVQERDPRQRAESAAIESATAWLERIIRLRRDGRHSEADAELKLFRERYPQVQPPSEALPPTPAQ